MKKPFICIAGKNNIGVNVLEYIVKHYGKDDVCVVCNSTETGENSFQRSLRKYAKQNEIKELTLNEVYNITNLVFLSLEFDKIVKPELFKDARLYNIHFSLLPKYKGMYTSAHPILNGEKYSGVTLHCIDSGIDTGNIIDQESFLLDGCNSKELYLKYIEYGTNLVLKNIENLIWDRVISTRQEQLFSTYYSKNSILYNDIIIDTNQTAESINRQIRAYSFRDYQMPKINNRNVIDSRILDSCSSEKNRIIIKKESYEIISTIDYNLVIYYDRFQELMDACEVGDVNKVKEICTVKKHINEQDKNGWSPIIKATFFNQKDIVEFLVSMGANIYVQNRNGTNLLMYAKDVYKKYKDNYLFKMFVQLGIPLREKDYNDRDVISYIKEESFSLEELLQ